MTTENDSLSSSSKPEVSILIPAFNEEKLIGHVIDNVRASFSTIGWSSYEVVVCDNNSTDRTGEIATSRGAVVVKESHNQIARARNTAAKSAQGRWLIFLDADSFLSPQLLRNTITVLQAGRICAGGSVLKFDREDIGWFASFMFRLWNRVSVWFNVAAGSYLFCYRKAWEAVGGFDESVYAGEELYFSRRLKKWARANALKFKVLDGDPIITSARKMDWYGSWELFRHVLLMARPGAMKRREACSLWYTRPGSDGSTAV